MALPDSPSMPGRGPLEEIHVLLDHCTPRPLWRVLYEHGIRCETAERLGWEELDNGVLQLEAEKAGFAALITVDRDMEDDYPAIRSPLPLPVFVLRVLTQRLDIYAKLIREQVVPLLREGNCLCDYHVFSPPDEQELRGKAQEGH